jgi:monovalent cation/hydrogen antiporter
MGGLQTVLGLLVAVAGLGIVARRVGVPHPIALVIGGLLIGLLPFVPRVELAPDLVFLLFLPPLLYVAAFFTSVREFRAQGRPIFGLAIGLVLATTAGVAVVAHWAMPNLGWAAAFALGAIVSPPDAVAATAIFRQVRAPREVVTVLEGESLLNDATGLVAYRFAAAAVVTGMFSVVESGINFLYVAIVGVAIGLMVGWLSGKVRSVLRDPPVEITISLLTPFAAYLPAEAVHASGVLATVACGLYLGLQSPRLMDAATRVQSRAVWETLIFVLDGLVFVLIGLQLPGIVAALGSRPVFQLVGQVVLVCGSVVLIRFAWVFLTDLPRLVRRTAPNAWREDVVVSWVGMRGVVSLAAALALPFVTADGSPFPERDLLIFLTVCVIVVTLVGQGLSLPWVIRAVGLRGDGREEHEEASARQAATSAAVARIEELAMEWPNHLPLIDTLRSQYAHQASHLGDHVDEADGQHRARASEAEQELIEHRAIRHAVLEAQRNAILELRDSGVINDDVLREVERDLDLEELRMEA